MNRKGFTLLEVLVAAAAAGLIFVCVLMLVVKVSGSWSTRSQRQVITADIHWVFSRIEEDLEMRLWYIGELRDAMSWETPHGQIFYKLVGDDSTLPAGLYRCTHDVGGAITEDEMLLDKVERFIIEPEGGPIPCTLRMTLKHKQLDTPVTREVSIPLDGWVLGPG